MVSPFFLWFPLLLVSCLLTVSPSSSSPSSPLPCLLSPLLPLLLSPPLPPHFCLLISTSSFLLLLSSFLPFSVSFPPVSMSFHPPFPHCSPLHFPLLLVMFVFPSLCCCHCHCVTAVVVVSPLLSLCHHHCCRLAYTGISSPSHHCCENVGSEFCVGFDIIRDGFGGWKKGDERKTGYDKCHSPFFNTLDGPPT